MLCKVLIDKGRNIDGLGNAAVQLEMGYDSAGGKGDSVIIWNPTIRGDISYNKFGWR